MTAGAPVQVQFDGASIGARAGWGFTVQGAGIDHEGHGGLRVEGPDASSRSTTNNVAEYTGAIRALEYLLSRGYRGPVAVFGDSQLIVRQFQGEYRVRAEHLVPLYERLRSLAREFERVSFEWVPRELNRRADALSKQGLQDF